MRQEAPGLVDQMESFVWDDKQAVCFVCGLKGHDTNLTGNTPNMAMAACVKTLRALVVALTEEQGHPPVERGS